MRDLQGITQVRVTNDSAEVNRLLGDWCELLDVFHNDDGLFFVLGSRELRGAEA